MKRYLCAFVLLCFSGSVYAQTPVWAFNIGSSITTASQDVGFSCKIAPNGNVYVTGKFSGTMDLDPGAGVYNITSNGGTDIFLACYTSAGSFLWGFGIGGSNYDGAYSMDVDPSSNVIIGGFQQGGADFDPGAGTTVLPFVGGTSLTYEGDGFVAKYSSTGVFQWAKDLGGPTVYDFTEGIATDALGNVYVGGEFNNTMTISGSITFSSATAGTGYLIKYNPSGTVIWGHNFGEFGTAAVDCAIASLVVKNGFVYACGVFRGPANFDPWGSVPGTCASSGLTDFDAFVSKYDTAGNFVFVQQIKGAGLLEQALSLSLDASGNIYVTGFGNSPSLIFNTASPATSTVTAPGGGGNYDMFLAKYSNAGVYQWGKMIGGSGDDIGRAVDVNGSVVTTSGQFSNTVDFDPSPSTADLISSGGTDMYLAKYDLAGNYLCAFRVGTASLDDIGYGLCQDTLGYTYTTGQFGGTATDFDPTPGVFPLTSNGGNDAYLAKYNWAGPFSGYMTGDTVCAGLAGMLTIHITLGTPGPYTVTIMSGLSSFTVTGVMSGVPFYIPAIPLVTTTYTVASIAYSGGSLCSVPSGSILGSATVVVHSLPAVTPVDTMLCNVAHFSAPSGVGTYFWNFGDGDTLSGNPVSHIYVATGSYSVSLTVTDINGCSVSDTISVTSGIVTVNLGPDQSFCGTVSDTLAYSAADMSAVYLWNTGSAANTIPVTAPGTYWLSVTIGSCAGSDTVVISETAIPAVDLGPDVTVCEGQTVTLLSIDSYSGPSYSWSTGSTSASVTVSTAGAYILSVTQNGCTGADTVNVTTKPLPTASLPEQPSFCTGSKLIIGSAEPLGVTYAWSTGSNDSALIVDHGGTYTLTVTKDGCSQSAVAKVIENNIPAPSLHFGPDTVLCEEQELLLRTDDNTTKWSDGTVGKTMNVTKKGIYWATITNDCGTASDTVKVDYAPCNIWFPNAFTPNGDGKNDIARVTGLLKYYTNYSLSIYNRFGQRVYFTEDIYSGWDGIFNGVEQDLGTYFYMIFYKLNGEQHMMKGDLTLVR